MFVSLFVCFFSEPITFVDRPEVESVKENEEAVIKCMVTGVPEPTISWYFNGRPLNRNTCYKVEHPFSKYFKCLSDSISS